MSDSKVVSIWIDEMDEVYFEKPDEADIEIYEFIDRNAYDKLKLRVTELEDANDNCISINLHESIMWVKDQELEKCKNKRSELKQQMEEAIAGRDQWRSTHLKLTETIKSLNEILTDDYWYRYKPFIDEKGVERPGLIKNISIIKENIKQILEKIK